MDARISENECRQPQALVADLDRLERLVEALVGIDIKEVGQLSSKFSLSPRAEALAAARLGPEVRTMFDRNPVPGFTLATANLEYGEIQGPVASEIDTGGCLLPHFTCGSRC